MGGAIRPGSRLTDSDDDLASFLSGKTITCQSNILDEIQLIITRVDDKQIGDVSCITHSSMYIAGLSSCKNCVQTLVVNSLVHLKPELAARSEISHPYCKICTNPAALHL